MDIRDKDENTKNVKESGTHSGHRNRLRDKFIEGGADCLASHELLELLLFSCVPRRNTNDIAHSMIERFGSLEKVLEADIAELESFDYITKTGAVLIRLVNEIKRRCNMEKATTVYRYDTLDKVGTLLKSLFYGQNTEKLYLLLFDGQMRLLDCVHICDGSVNDVKACFRKMAERLIFSKATAAILSHNHPGGLVIPSKEDISVNKELETLFGYMGTKLLTHIIVAGDRYAPINHIGNDLMTDLL